IHASPRARQRSGWSRAKSATPRRSSDERTFVFDERAQLGRLIALPRHVFRRDGKFRGSLPRKTEPPALRPEVQIGLRGRRSAARALFYSDAPSIISLRRSHWTSRRTPDPSDTSRNQGC